jgi:hypothetical protein
MKKRLLFSLERAHQSRFFASSIHPLQTSSIGIGGSQYSNILESARAAILSSPSQSPSSSSSSSSPSPSSILLKQSAEDLDVIYFSTNVSSSSTNITSSSFSPLLDVATLIRALQATPHSAKHIILLPSLQVRLGQLCARSDICAAFLHCIAESIQLNPQLKSAELLKAAEAAFEAFEQSDSQQQPVLNPQHQQQQQQRQQSSNVSTMVSSSTASSTNRVFANFITVLGLYGTTSTSRIDALIRSLLIRGIWPERTLLNSLVRSHTLSGAYAKAYQWYSALPEFGVQPNAKSKALLASLIISAEESGQSLGLRSLVRESSVFGFFSHFSTHGSDDSSASSASSSELSDGSGTSRDHLNINNEEEDTGAGRYKSSISSSLLSSSPSTAPLDLYVGLLMRPFIPEQHHQQHQQHNSDFSDHHHHFGSGGGKDNINSSTLAVVNERFSALDAALNVATSLCLADPDGRVFKTLWRDDLRATLVRAAYLEPDVARIFGAGRRSAINAAFKSLAISRQLLPATQRKRSSKGGGGGRVEKEMLLNNHHHSSVGAPSSTMSNIWKSVEADAVRSRALSLIRKVNSALESLQAGIGARIDPSATTRSLLVSRSGDIIRLLRSMRIEPKQAVLGAYVRTVVLGGQPHMLRQVLSLVSERPSGAAASHISDVLRSACTPQFASTVYSLLPELTAVGIRPSGDVLGELIEAATKAWVAGQVYSCPTCLELITIGGNNNGSSKGAAGGGGGSVTSSKVTSMSTTSVVTRSLQYEAKRLQSVLSHSVNKATEENHQQLKRTLSSTGTIENEKELVDDINNNNNGDFIDVLPSSSLLSSSSSGMLTTINSRNSKSGLSSTPPWALDGAKPSASALAAISNASVRCIAGQSNSALSLSPLYDSSSSLTSSNLTLYPSRQLAVLSATGLLGSVPESALVQLARAAANSLCGREAWTVWQHMRYLKLHAAHLDRGLLRQLTLSFIAGRLQLPAWEAFLVLYPRPASKLTILPSLETISELVEAEAAAESSSRPLLSKATPSTSDVSSSTTSSSSASSPPILERVESSTTISSTIESREEEEKGKSKDNLSKIGSNIKETLPKSIDNEVIASSTISVSQPETKRRYIPHHFRSKCTQRTPLTDAEMQTLSHIAVPVSQGRYFRSCKPVITARINKNMLEVQSDFERVAADIQKALIVGARQSPKAGLEHVLVNGSSLVQVLHEQQQQQRQHGAVSEGGMGKKNTSSLNNNASESSNSSNSNNMKSIDPSTTVTVEIYLSIPAWIEGKHIVPGDLEYARILEEAKDRLTSSGSIRVKLPPVGAGAKDESWRVGRLEVM